MARAQELFGDLPRWDARRHPALNPVPAHLPLTHPLNQTRAVSPARAALWAGAAALTVALGGCSEGVLAPVGPVGAGERLILLDSLAIMLAIVVPVIVCTLAFAWWFRASNTRAKYLPDWSYSGKLELVIWSIPAMVVLFLGGIGWAGAHLYDPPRPLASKLKPLTIQVVALDWKWLFIYPDQSVASVNRVEVPVGTPVQFQITSATVMNAFFAPRLGGMIYAMAGMVTRLNLQADKPGVYPGLAAQLSGDGFSEMRFKVDAVSPQQFKGWVAAAQASPQTMDAATYARLARPSIANTAATYKGVPSGFFGQIVGASAPGTNGLPTNPVLASPARAPAYRG